MRLLALPLLLYVLFFQEVHAQQNFQKIYSFQGERSYIQDIYFADSCYYFTGAIYDFPSRYKSVFGKISLTGDLEFERIDSTSAHYQWARWTRTDLQKNYRGNLTTCYVITDSAYTTHYPIIKEYDSDGIILDTIRVDQLVSDSVRFYSAIKLIANNSDSTYYVLATYEDLTPDYVNPVIEAEERGAMVLKLNAQGDTIWTKRFYIKWTPSGRPVTRGLDIQFKDDSTLVVSVFEDRQAAPSNYHLWWSRIRYYTMSTNGEVFDWILLNDGQYIGSKPEFLIVDDSTFIQSYADSRLSDDNIPDFEFQGVLSSITKYNTMLWKDSLISLRGNYFSSSAPNCLKYVDSTSFIGAYTYYKRDSITYPFLAQYARVFKRKTNGERVWERDYSIGAFDSIRADYDIVDIEVLPDGGIAAAGMIRMYTFNPNYSFAGEKGYILKTDCLGFVDSLEANFSFEIQEGLVVKFMNESTSAGGYYWDFGDGTSFTTGEGNDTIYHQFPGFGPYEVSLIGTGCNEATDTFSIEVNPVQHFDPTSVFDDDLLAIFPNPVHSGKNLFVYLNQIDLSQKDVFLDLFTMDGRHFVSLNLETQESVHRLEKWMGSGMYHAILRKGSSTLVRTKLVVL